MPLLRVPQPYDFHLSTTRFRAFGRDAANVWHEDGLHRVIAGREVRIEAAPGGASVEPLDAEIALVARHLLGVPFDLEAFRVWAADDPLLARIEEQLRGLRPPLAPDPFETLITSITAQQVSLFAAFAVRSRMIETFGERHGLVWSFPTPERLMDVREEELLGVGFSRRKAEYAISLAGRAGELRELADVPDEEVKARITSLRGLGEWTADWFLARHLARPRAWPAGDLGLRKAVSAFYGGGRVLSTEEVRALGPRFEPFQNLTAHYLLAASQLGVS
jgi:DNA-3-methyladenine glycosylase II